MAADRFVPVFDGAESEQLARLARCDRMQQLMAGRTDWVRIVRVSSYGAKAFAPEGKLSFRWMRLNAACELEDTEWTVVICHELAHLTAGLEHHHNGHFRATWQELVSEAADLGLLTEEREAQATRMVLVGAASVFRGWPENARRRGAEHEEQLAAIRNELTEMGVAPGVQIVYRYGHGARRAFVIRVNGRTVSVGQPGSGEVLRRVPLNRVLGVWNG